jgi:hypothetical protein
MTERIEEIQARRAARKAQAELLIEEQQARDLEVADELEMEHGDHNVRVVNLASPVPGLPTLVVVRCPKTAEVKRWQSRMKQSSKGKPADGIAAAEELATPCILYPAKDACEQLFAERYALKFQLGQHALSLHDAKAEEQGKD